MAVPEEAIPTLSECQCKICLEILIEPVTLPCEHTLCKPCFQSIVEKSNLCCPFCRLWISGWTRYHTRRNSLVNMELWEKIQKHYPEECKRRVSCQESEESYNDFQPIRLLSEPGELRREYEEEVRKMEALQRADKEEENRASEEYIKKLLAEEEEKRKKEIALQLKSDKELARKISFNINFCEETGWANTPYSRKQIITRSKTKIMNQQTNTEGIQEYLSPKSQSQPVSLSEVVQEGKKNSMSKESNSSDIKSPMFQGTEIEGITPTVSSQICHESQEQDSKPQCLGGEVKRSPTNSGKTVFCIMVPEKPKARIPYSIQAAVKPRRKRESKSVVSDITQITETENEESYLQGRKNDNSKGKQQESLCEAVGDPCSSPKRGKMFPEASTDQEETEDAIPQTPLDSGHLLFERENQEEQDILSDKEPTKPTLPKGSPSE